MADGGVIVDTLFKIIELPKMKMASFHVTNSEKPEEEAFERLKLWAEPRGLCQLPPSMIHPSPQTLTHPGN